MRRITTLSCYRGPDCRRGLILAGAILSGASWIFGLANTAAAPPLVDDPPSALRSSALGSELEGKPIEPPELPRLPEPQGVKSMPKPHLVWIDSKRKQVLVDGYVSLNEGLLEMFACPSGTKEHESVVAVLCSAQMVHTALLAVGAKVGHPVKWDPQFKPPTGTEIEIEVRWLDAEGNWQSQSAQKWLYDVKNKKAMDQVWVFAGSQFWKDEETGQEFYQAESGDLICVSNFSSATLDIPVESSQANSGLLFEAYKKNIPAIGTPVRLVLKPKFPEKRSLKDKGPKNKDPRIKDPRSKDPRIKAEP